jgi:hypothetical protein
MVESEGDSWSVVLHCCGAFNSNPSADHSAQHDTLCGRASSIIAKEGHPTKNANLLGSFASLFCLLQRKQVPAVDGTHHRLLQSPHNVPQRRPDSYYRSITRRNDQVDL